MNHHIAMVTSYYIMWSMEEFKYQFIFTKYMFYVVFLLPFQLSED